MKNYFKISDFIIDLKRHVPFEIMKSIYKDHLSQANKIREAYGDPVWISKNSCYRSEQYEKEKGRSGNSQHTFKDITDGKRGACDYTAHNIDKLLQAIIEHSEYKRICYYPKSGFIHCDYNSMQRQLFNDYGNGWEFIRNLK